MNSIETSSRSQKIRANFFPEIPPGLQLFGIFLGAPKEITEEVFV